MVGAVSGGSVGFVVGVVVGAVVGAVVGSAEGSVAVVASVGFVVSGGCVMSAVGFVCLVSPASVGTLLSCVSMVFFSKLSVEGVGFLEAQLHRSRTNKVKTRNILQKPAVAGSIFNLFLITNNPCSR